MNPTFARMLSLALLLGAPLAGARADDWSKLSTAPISRENLVDARVGIQTDQGRRAILDVKSGDDLLVERIQYLFASGDKTLVTPVRIPGTYTMDVDTATVGAAGADIWWCRDGRVSDTLVPMNGALICLLGPAPDPFAPKVPAAFANANLSERSIPREDLRAARVLVVTDEGNYAIFDVRAGDDLGIDRLEVFDRTGRRILLQTNFQLASSFTLDLDTGRSVGRDGDVWWRWDANDRFTLIPQNGARMALAR